MAEERVQRRLAAIIAADVVGYSRLMGADEAGTLSRLNALRSDLLHPKVSEYGGRIVKTTGDGTLIEFPSAVDAVQHAVDVQQALAHRNADLPEKERIEIRMGINLGDIIVQGEDIYGDGVNVAARLEALSEPGGVYISDLVQASIRNKLDIALDDLGEQLLKNIAEPVRVYRVVLDGGTTGGNATAMDALFRRPAVAVLPFENLSGNPEQEYFADGLTEDLITALSLWRSFPVIARNSTFAYKGQSPDVREVGKSLGARYIVEGSVQKSGNRVRVTGQLINTETGHHVWAERFDRDLTDVFELQDEITQRIAAIVAPELERAEHKRIAVLKPQNLGSWDLVLKGMAFLNDFGATNNLRARELFKQAIALDPNYGRAYTGLAFTYHRELVFGVNSANEQALAKLLENASLAVQLEPADWLAHWELSISNFRAGRHDQGYEEAHKALELNPTSFQAHGFMGYALIVIGRPDEAITHLEKSLALNPSDPKQIFPNAYLGRAYFDAQRYDEALTWLQKAIDQDSNMLQAQILLTACFGHLERISDAQEPLEICERLHPKFMTAWAKYYSYKNTADEEHLRNGLRKAGWEG